MEAWNRALPGCSDGFTHLQDLKHDGETQFERLELTQEILDLSLLEAPFDPLDYCDGSKIALFIFRLGQVDHVPDLVEDDLTLIPYLCCSLYGARCRDCSPLLHGLADLLEHEREEGDALGDTVDVAFSIGHLGCDCVENEREAEASPRDPDDGGYDAVEHGVSHAADMIVRSISARWSGVPNFCHSADWM